MPENFVKCCLLVGVDHCLSGFLVSQLTRNTRQGELGNGDHDHDDDNDDDDNDDDDDDQHHE